MEPPETDLFLSPTSGGSKGDDSGLKKVCWETRRAKNRQLNTCHEDVKTVENNELTFRVSSKKGSHTRRAAVKKTKPANKFVRTSG